MKKFILMSFLIVLIIFLTPTHSYGIKKLGQVGFKFLDVGVGARPTAMGEAYTVSGNDANALFYNPAGVASIKSKFELSVSITDWIADISYNAIAVVYNGGIWGTFGFTMISPDYGVIPGTQVADVPEGYIETGNVDCSAFSGGLSYARSLTDKFKFGAKVKYASQHLGESQFETEGEFTENRLSTFAYDVGTLYNPGLGGAFESLTLGMYVKNYAPSVKYEITNFSLPLTYCVGIGMDILDFFGDHPGRSFDVEIDAIHPRDYSERVHIGGEYRLEDKMSIRMGYKFNYDEANLTLGVGLNISGLKVDYSYGDFGRFNPVNRISLGIAF